MRGVKLGCISRGDSKICERCSEQAISNIPRASLPLHATANKRKPEEPLSPAKTRGAGQGVKERAKGNDGAITAVDSDDNDGNDEDDNDDANED